MEVKNPVHAIVQARVARALGEASLQGTAQILVFSKNGPLGAGVLAMCCVALVQERAHAGVKDSVALAKETL